MTRDDGDASPPPFSVSDAEIVARVIGGETVYEIAHAYGIGRQTVILAVERHTGMTTVQLREAHGVALRPNPSLQARYEDVVTRLLIGENVQDIASALDLHSTTVTRYVRRATGMTAAQFRRTNGVARPVDEEIVAQVLGGLASSEIAKHHGISDTYVAKACRRHTGLTPGELQKAHGVTRHDGRTTPARHLEILDEDIVARVMAGETNKVIAEHYGVAAVMVTRRIRRFTGMTPTQLRQQTGIVSNRPDYSDIVARVLDGEPIRDIALDLGLSSIDVNYRVRRATGRTPSALLAQQRGEALKGPSSNELPNVDSAKTYPEVSDKEIVAKVIAGQNVADIARHYGFSKATVAQRTLRHTGMTPTQLRQEEGPPRTRPSIPDQGEEMADLYLAGMTTVQIADWFGVHESSVRRALDFQRVKRRSIKESREIGLRRASLDPARASDGSAIPGRGAVS